MSRFATFSLRFTGLLSKLTSWTQSPSMPLNRAVTLSSGARACLLLVHCSWSLLMLVVLAVVHSVACGEGGVHTCLCGAYPVARISLN
jgi:hypothetical protein